MKILLASIAALMFSTSLYAADNDTATVNPVEEPDTIILSDTLHYDDIKKVSTFTGNVILTRGGLTLRSEKLVMHEDEAGNQFGVATADPGEIVTINQENPEKFETIV